MTKDRRLGKFRIARKMIDLDAAVVRRVMFHMIIWKAEYLGYVDAIEYTATSNLFEICPEGQVPPFYSVIIKDKYKVKAKKGLM